MARKAVYIKYGKEPTLHLHRYIVGVSCQKTSKKGKPSWYTKYHYCRNLEEVLNLRNCLPKGRVVEVYEAHHNFREAWEIK